jgi:hypothetical protein
MLRPIIPSWPYNDAHWGGFGLGNKKMLCLPMVFTSGINALVQAAKPQAIVMVNGVSVRRAFGRRCWALPPWAPLMRWLGGLFGLLAISAASATEQQTLRQLSEVRILGFLVLSGCIVEASEHGAMGHHRRLYVRQCVEAKPAPPTAPTR